MSAAVVVDRNDISSSMISSSSLVAALEKEASIKESANATATAIKLAQLESGADELMIEKEAVQLAEETEAQRAIREADEAATQISKKHDIICAIVFTICGNASLYYWNALLNCVFDVIAQKYPEYPSMSDDLTAVDNTLTTATSILLIFLGGGVRPWFMYTGFSLLAFSCIAFALIVQFMDGSSGKACLLSLQIFAGVGAGLVESGGFGYACILPKIYAGWVSFGMGVSGILSFAIYMLFSETVFKGNVEGNVWVNMGVSTVLSLAAIVAFWWLHHWPVAQESVRRLKEKKHMVESEEEKGMSWWHVFLATFGPQFMMFFIMWLTLFLFPNVGPLAWNDNSSKTNTVMGMFQLGDFLGRYIPNLGRFIPFVMFSKTWLYILGTLRLVYIPIFIFCKIWTTSPWNNFGVQILLMLTLAITNGWYVTLSLIYAPQAVEKQSERNKASALATCAMLLGITTGLWMAKIFELF